MNKYIADKGQPEIIGNYTTYVQQRSWAGRQIYHYDVLDSTNAQLKRMAEEAECGTTDSLGECQACVMGDSEPVRHGAVVVAETQTAGRGRRGRQWNSSRGTGLWFSMLLKPDISPEHAPMLTLVAAMAVARAIEQMAGIRPGIKWPNDIVLSGKKVCGILTEMKARADGIDYIILGIGINVKVQEFPEEIVQIATSLETECRCTIDMDILLEAVLKEFEHYYDLYMRTLDFRLMQDEYNRCLVNRDKQVKVLDPQGAYEGIARGINAQGELLVEREGRIYQVNSGEVSVRGIYGYV